MSSVETQLMAVTPIDGRYADRVEPLTQITSEFALIRYRLAVEAGYLSTLGSGILPDREPLPDRAHDYLAKLPTNFTLANAVEIKGIEKKTNHDVNAVVRWLETRLEAHPVFGDYKGLVHLCLTSEDVNSLATAMMVRDARDQVLMPGLESIYDGVQDKAHEWADIPMLGHTHGQHASPPTLGLEMAVFGKRLGRHMQNLGAISMLGKFGGATGTLAAHVNTYPEVDWVEVTRAFVEDRMGFELNDTTTQIEPHDWLAGFLKEVATGNTILFDMSADMWLYTMIKYLKLIPDPNDDGSSAMPNKVNPIDFENAESNFGSANALLGHLAATLPISRLQRHLSDSSSLRTLGEAFGHTLVGQNSVLKGLGKISPNEDEISSSLEGDYGVLMELVQNVGCRYRVADSYDRIKALSRGMKVDKQAYESLVVTLGLPENVTEKLLATTPSMYTGLSSEIARR